MSLIENNEVVNKIIFLIKLYYKCTFHENLDDIDIYVTDNINNDTILFADINAELLSLKCNGRFIQPNEVSPRATVLIDIDTFKVQGYPFVATILHELTHACDYKKFVKDYCNNNWIEIINHPCQETFSWWTEFHARTLSILHMYYLLSIIYPNEFTYDEREIRYEMLHIQLPRYNQELLENIRDDNIIYELIKYCARFYVCKLYNPHLLLDECIPKQIHSKFPLIDVLYINLEQAVSYEEFVRLQDVLSVVLDSLLL